MFGRLGPMELILILVIALVIFGPGKLPDIGKSFGKAVREFKYHANSMEEVVKEVEQKETESKG